MRSWNEDQDARFTNFVEHVFYYLQIFLKHLSFEGVKGSIANNFIVRF